MPPSLTSLPLLCSQECFDVFLHVVPVPGRMRCGPYNYGEAVRRYKACLGFCHGIARREFPLTYLPLLCSGGI